MQVQRLKQDLNREIKNVEERYLYNAQVHAEDVQNDMSRCVVPHGVQLSVLWFRISAKLHESLKCNAELRASNVELQDKQKVMELEVERVTNQVDAG